jgi:hypothetical protein
MPAISRTQLLLESAMKRLPFLSKARPAGRASVGFVPVIPEHSVVAA